MAHIHTKPGQHDHTSSAFIVRLDMDEPRLMLHLHKKLGKYLQFGGHIELDENPWQAITHELLEESGYTLDQLKLMQPLDRIDFLSESTLHPVAICHNTHKFDDNHKHSDIEYLFVADSPPKHQVGEGESDNFIYLSRHELSNWSDHKISNDHKIKFTDGEYESVTYLIKVLPNPTLSG